MKYAAASFTYPRVLTGLYHCFLWQPLLVGVSTIAVTFVCYPFVLGNISATYFISDNHPVTDARREFRIKLLP